MAQSYEEARNALSNFTRTQWEAAVAAAGHADAPLTYDNISFDPPEDLALWGRLTIHHLEGARASLGGASARFRRQGMVSIQVFTPIGEGTLLADRVGDPLVEAFEIPGQIDNIWFRNARMREVGSDGTAHQVNVEVEFIFDRRT